MTGSARLHRARRRAGPVSGSVVAGRREIVGAGKRPGGSECQHHDHRCKEAKATCALHGVPYRHGGAAQAISSTLLWPITLSVVIGPQCGNRLPWDGQPDRAPGHRFRGQPGSWPTRVPRGAIPLAPDDAEAYLRALLAASACR